MNSNDLYNNLKELWEEFDSNHNVFVDKGNKAAGSRARKAIGEIKKLVTEYGKRLYLNPSNEHSIVSWTFSLWAYSIFVLSQRYILA